MPGRDHRGVKIATTAALQPGATAGLAWDFGLPQPPEMGVGVVPVALRRASRWLAFLPARDLALDLSHGAPADGSESPVERRVRGLPGSRHRRQARWPGGPVREVCAPCQRECRQRCGSASTWVVGLGGPVSARRRTHVPGVDHWPTVTCGRPPRP